MSTHRETAHIAKYDGQNYSLWKLGLFVLFEQHNLTDLVTGEQPIPKEVENINHVLIFKKILLIPNTFMHGGIQ